MSKGPKRYVMVVDLQRCVGCNACTVSCKLEHDVPTGNYRTWVLERENGTFPEVDNFKLPRLCNHCDNPPCHKACPTGATFVADNGAVLIDSTVCIGCRYCMAACPYNARFINRRLNVADKCTFCFHRIEEGLQPACVSTCVGHSRVFGDANDPDSKVSQLIRNHETQRLDPELGTDPQVYYIVPPETTLKALWSAKEGDKP